MISGLDFNNKKMSDIQINFDNNLLTLKLRLIIVANIFKFFMYLFNDLVINSYNFNFIKLYKFLSNFYKNFTAILILPHTYIHIMKFYSTEITLASMRKLCIYCRKL